MQIVNQNKSILFEDVNGRDYVILKEDIKIVKLGTDSIAVYDSQSRQKDVRRLVINYSDVTSPTNISSGQSLFNALNELINDKTQNDSNISEIESNTRELKRIKDELKEVNKWLRKIYSPI